MWMEVFGNPMDTERQDITVLHVDDDPAFADLTAEFLGREHGFDVASAADADEGLDALSEGDVDCVVSDYDMPGRNGIGFLEAVRDDRPDLPFILFTGKGSEDVASDAISAGVTDYLQKRPGGEQYELLANRIDNAVSQYRAERDVDRTRRRFRRLIEESTDVITVVGEDGMFRYLSQAAERLLGYPAEELVGENGFEYMHPDDREFMMAEFARQVEHPERRVTAEFRFECADGSWTWLEARGRNLRDDPVIGGIVVYARDVTERKEREAELEATRERLERKNRRLEEFTGVVSHDIRNPLTVAEGRLDLAREERDSEHLEAVADAHDRIRALIRELLSSARRDDTVSDADRVDLSGLAAECWRNVATGDARLAVETERAIRADESRFKRLLENLYRNAVEHGSASSRSETDDAGGGRGVTVTVAELGDGNGFFVADDGPGIPEGEREAVLEGGYSTAEDGTGFGLAIVNGIAEAHGWEVAVTDSEAGGTRIEITGVGFVGE